MACFGRRPDGPAESGAKERRAAGGGLASHWLSQRSWRFVEQSGTGPGRLALLRQGHGWLVSWLENRWRHRGVWRKVTGLRFSLALEGFSRFLPEGPWSTFWTLLTRSSHVVGRVFAVLFAPAFPAGGQVSGRTGGRSRRGCHC